MGERTLEQKFTLKKILIKLGSSLVLGLFVLFIGLIVTFFIFIMGFGSPYLNKLSGIVDPITLDREMTRIGYYEPLSIQFIIFISNFFSGNWGESFIVSEGMPIMDLINTVLPKTIETMLIPMIIGLVGIKLGRIWVKKRKKAQGYIIQIFTIIGLSMPVFLLGTMLQLNSVIVNLWGIRGEPHSSLMLFFGTLEVIFHHNPILPLSPFITGLPLFDSILDGNWILAEDIILHGILPTVSLSIVVLALITKQTKKNIDRNSKETSFVSNASSAGKLFGILFALVLLVELTFNLTGFGYHIYLSLILGDIFLIMGLLFMIIILFSFT
ncbi:MAG: hypothetical protein ACW98D_17215, partial [Promethearchaeota archaeon]